MNIDNITSKGITLDENGKLMQIEIYEKQIKNLNCIIEIIQKHIEEYLEEKQNSNEDWYKGQCLLCEDILCDIEMLKEIYKC